MPVTVPFGSPAGSTTAGIVGTYSAPVVVTRRFQFLASSYLNPVECASLAIAAFIPQAPALTLNWISLLLPLQTEASDLGWQRPCCCSFHRLIHSLGSLRGPYTLEWGHGTTCTEIRMYHWIVNCFLFHLPFPFHVSSLPFKKKNAPSCLFFFF